MNGMKILIIVTLLLCALSVGVSVYFYSAFRVETAYMEQQNQSVNGRLNAFGMKLADFRTAVDNFDMQFKSYIENLNAFNQTINSADAKQKSILSSMNEIKKEIQDLRNSYAGTLEDLRGKVQTLESALEASGKDVKQKVELGAISVEKSSQKKK
jgi:archaellum component FlaC